MMANDDELEMNMLQLIETNRKWVEQRQMELLEKEAARDRLIKECEGIRNELSLMVAWLDKVSGQHRAKGESIPVGSGDNNQEKISHFTQVPETTPEEKGDIELRGDRLRDEVARILLEVYPEGLYYRDLLLRLKERGYKVSGKDPGLNLIAHMTHDDRFQRGDKRGVYVLSASHVNK